MAEDNEKSKLAYEALKHGMDNMNDMLRQVVTSCNQSFNQVGSSMDIAMQNLSGAVDIVTELRRIDGPGSSSPRREAPSTTTTTVARAPNRNDEGPSVVMPEMPPLCTVVGDLSFMPADYLEAKEKREQQLGQKRPAEEGNSSTGSKRRRKE